MYKEVHICSLRSRLDTVSLWEILNRNVMTILAQVRAQKGWVTGEMLHSQKVTKPGLQTLNTTKG